MLFLNKIENRSYSFYLSFNLISESPQPTSAPTTTETNKDLWSIKNDLNNSVNGQQTPVNSIDKSKFNLCETLSNGYLCTFIFKEYVFFIFVFELRFLSYTFDRGVFLLLFSSIN